MKKSGDRSAEPFHHNFFDPCLGRSYLYSIEELEIFVSVNLNSASPVLLFEKIKVLFKGI
jgi:hypothetical protein